MIKVWFALTLLGQLAWLVFLVWGAFHLIGFMFSR
jgi:hypothetical protein